MNKLNLNSLLLALVAAFAPSFASAMPVAQLKAPAQPATRVASIKATLERGLSQSLSREQANQIQAFVEGLESAPQPVLFGRNTTSLICIGATLAYVLKAQIAVCSDSRAIPYFIQSVSYGAVFGAAGQVFIFSAMHDEDQPIAPQFMAGTIGATSGRAAELFNILKGMAQVAPLLGPNVGAFHSMIGNQAGFLIGLNLGKVIGFDLGQILIYDSFSEMVAGIRSGVWSIDADEFKARIEARKERISKYDSVIVD